MKNWELVFIKNISFVCSYKMKENSNKKKLEQWSSKKFSCSSSAPALGQNSIAPLLRAPAPSSAPTLCSWNGGDLFHFNLFRFFPEWVIGSFQIPRNNVECVNRPNDKFKHMHIMQKNITWRKTFPRILRYTSYNNRWICVRYVYRSVRVNHMFSPTPHLFWYPRHKIRTRCSVIFLEWSKSTKQRSFILN